MSGSLLNMDGSFGEGGGALLRTALAMSTLTEQPVRISNVRGGTKHPGLDIEDLVLAHYLCEACNAQMEGFEIGSHEVTFAPTRRPQGITGALSPPVSASGGRGANGLIVANTLLPILARSGVYNSFSVTGETFGLQALSYDYFQNVCLPAYKRLGLHAFSELEKGGFGREAKGVVTVDVEPSALQPIVWPERGGIRDCRAIWSFAQVSPQIAQRGAAHLTNLARAARFDMDIELHEVEADEPGIYLTIFAEYERGFGGATMMGAKGIRVESLAQSVMEDFLWWIRSNATMDSFLADQLLVALSLVEGESTFTVSQLTKRFLTAVWVVKQFAPIHITIKGKDGDRGSVTVSR